MPSNTVRGATGVQNVQQLVEPDRIEARGSVGAAAKIALTSLAKSSRPSCSAR